MFSIFSPTLTFALKSLAESDRPTEIPEPAFTPFELSHLQELPKDPDGRRTSRTTRTGRQETTAPAVFPPPVPNN